MNYVTYNQLQKDIVNWSSELSRDYDMIVGVPRSGLMVASILALHLNKHLGTVTENGISCVGFGERAKNLNTDYKKVLVMEDVVGGGLSIRKTKEILNRVSHPFQIEFASVYMLPGSENYVDYFYRLLPAPRFYEWNIFHCAYMEKSCVDIDGVLCQDPTESENDDGERYINFIRNASPLYIPTYKIHSLVTSRLEKYRFHTMEFLHKHGIKYDNLIMSPHKSKEERLAAKDHAKRKGEYYRQSNTCLFVESSLHQAKAIFNIAKKPVLCVETNQLIK